MTRQVITYPGAAVSQVPGLRRVENVPNPPAGQGWTFPIVDRMARPVSGQAHFLASAVVANRAVDVQISDGTGPVFRLTLPGSMVASQAWDINYVGGVITDVNAGSFNRASIGLPQPWIPPGWTISAPTQNIDVADQWSGVRLWMEYFDIGALGEEVGLHPPTIPELVDLHELH